MSNDNTKSNKLETMPVGKLLASMSIPMMISFFIQAMYNIVDSIFVARISEDALTAVSLAMPMQQIAHAIAIGIGVGINATIPKNLGMKRRDRANKAAGNAITMDFILWCIFIVLAITLVPTIYRLQISDRTVINYGIIYLTICWCGIGGEFFGQIFEKMLVASGHSLYAMLSQASGAIFNIVFDPILIFGLGPFPKMGIAGAAIATISGQFVGGIIACILNIKCNKDINIGLSDLKLEMETVREIFAVGIPSMITIGLMSITTFLANQIFRTYSKTAIAVYGIWIKLQNFCYMPLFGMNNGMVPILSYNHARNNKDRVRKTMRLAITVSLAYMIILVSVLEMVPEYILILFDASSNMMDIGMIAVRACVLSIPFGGICIILTTSMQAMDHSRYTLLINIFRQLIIIVGLLFLISIITHNLNAVWFAIPLSEFISCGMAIGLENKMMRDMEIIGGEN